MAKILFVTVGTTSFDDLIQRVCHSEMIKVLKNKNFSSMTVQFGKGLYFPPNQVNGFPIHCYNYKNSIENDIKQAAVVISHAGAGCIIEVLEANRPLLVILNEGLMGNHQIELASKMAEQNYLYYTTCQRLWQDYENLDFSKLSPYIPGKPENFAKYLDNYFFIE